MRLIRLGAVVFTASIAGVFGHAAIAGECVNVAAAGDGPTKYIATIMSTNGLDNIIEGKGLKGQGPVQTKCKSGTFLVECRSQRVACK